jgi:ABC-type lipoprotein release transport system permease subunit
VAALLAVMLSAGIATGSFSLMQKFDRETELILKAKHQVVEQAWTRFKDNVRKTMLELGFNLVVTHKNQTLSTPVDQQEYLPESYAKMLKDANLATINHVLPFLEKKVWWPEQKRWVTLYGTPGEIQIKNPARQVPLVNQIDAGRASLGKGIHESLGLKEGDSFEFMQRTFIVQECRPAESFATDEQLRITLTAAQELLQLSGRISGLMAINCVCADPQGVARIRSDIQDLLPDTEVRENKGNMVVRVEERARVAREAEASLQREQASRKKLRAEREHFMAVLIVFVTLVAVIWLGLITWINVRQRRVEIAILRAMGWSNGRIMRLILGKALVLGVLGGFLGGLVGEWSVWGITILGAVGLALLASWIPALLATAIDPASVLQEEG